MEKKEKHGSFVFEGSKVSGILEQNSVITKFTLSAVYLIKGLESEL